MCKKAFREKICYEMGKKRMLSLETYYLITEANCLQMYVVYILKSDYIQKFLLQNKWE